MAADPWEPIYQERGARLTASDWIIDPPADIPNAVRDDIVSFKMQWVEYRQALRDITKQTDPLNIIWPIPPPKPDLIFSRGGVPL